MARVFKNKTAAEVSIQCDSYTQIISGGESCDLSLVFTPAQLQACDALIELLGQGSDQYQLNDGCEDLPVAQGIDLIRNIQRSRIKIDAPCEHDGKPNFVPVPFSVGLFMHISSRGDKLEDGVIKRGQGDKLLLSWDGATGDEEREALAELLETVELHDGHVDYDPSLWGWDDEWSIFVRIPASEVTPNGSNLGDCNLYMAQQLTPWDSGTSYVQGDLVTSNYVNYVCIEAHSNQEPPNATYWLNTANVIIPAAGDGAYDLTKVVVVPYNDQGYWDYEIWTDALTPHGAGGDWMLFDFQMDDVYLVHNVSPANPMGFWELDAYKVEPLYPRWQLGFKCKRPDHLARDPAKIGGHYTCFRKTTT